MIDNVNELRDALVSAYTELVKQTSELYLVSKTYHETQTQLWEARLNVIFEHIEQRDDDAYIELVTRLTVPELYERLQSDEAAYERVKLSYELARLKVEEVNLLVKLFTL